MTTPKTITLRQFVTEQHVQLVKFHAEYMYKQLTDPVYYDLEKEEQDWAETLNSWPIYD